jgi:hypothetical protein
MRRVMIQADDDLLERARRVARERGITFPQFVREALERELAAHARPIPPLTCVGVVSTGGEAARGEYRPDPWR